MKSIKKAIKVSGSITALAKSIGVVPSAISNWLARGGDIPIEHCTSIERATNGAVTRKDLRPNDWSRIWPELAGEVK